MNTLTPWRACLFLRGRTAGDHRRNPRRSRVAGLLSAAALRLAVRAPVAPSACPLLPSASEYCPRRRRPVNALLFLCRGPLSMVALWKLAWLPQKYSICFRGAPHMDSSPEGRRLLLLPRLDPPFPSRLPRSCTDRGGPVRPRARRSFLAAASPL